MTTARNDISANKSAEPDTSVGMMLLASAKYTQQHIDTTRSTIPVMEMLQDDLLRKMTIRDGTYAKNENAIAMYATMSRRVSDFERGKERGVVLAGSASSLTVADCVSACAARCARVCIDMTTAGVGWGAKLAGGSPRGVVTNGSMPARLLCLIAERPPEPDSSGASLVCAMPWALCGGRRLASSNKSRNCHVPPRATKAHGAIMPSNTHTCGPAAHAFVRELTKRYAVACTETAAGGAATDCSHVWSILYDMLALCGGERHAVRVLADALADLPPAARERVCMHAASSRTVLSDVMRAGCACAVSGGKSCDAIVPLLRFPSNDSTGAGVRRGRHLRVTDVGACGDGNLCGLSRTGLLVWAIVATVCAIAACACIGVLAKRHRAPK